MSNKTKITQEDLNALLPEIRNIVKGENGFGDDVDWIIDSVLTILLSHILEVTKEGGEEISIEDVRQYIQEFTGHRRLCHEFPSETAVF